ncbi:MAG: tetratricopeptide repeat protein [Acidobacteriota bacterium]
MAPSLAAEPVDAPSSSELAEATYLFTLGKMRADESDYKGAIEAFDRALAIDATDPYAFLEVGRFYSFLAQVSRSPVQRGRYLEEAVEHLGQARELAPTNRDVLRSFGELHIRLAERNPSSLALAQGAFESLRAEDEEDLQVLISLAQIYLWTRDATSAIDVLRDAEALSPGNRMIQSMLVEALLGSGEEQDAATALRSLLRLEPDEIEHRLRLAELLGRAGEHAEAVEVLESSPEPMRDDERLLRLLVRELQLAGESQEARALLERLAPPDGEEADEGFLRLRVAIHGSLLDYETAAADLETLYDAARAAGDASRRRQDAQLLARLEERLGRAARAEDLLRTELDAIDEQDSATAVQLRLALVDLLEREQRIEEAAALLRQGMAGAEVSRRVALGQVLAELLANADRPREAIELLESLAETLDAEAERVDAMAASASAADEASGGATGGASDDEATVPGAGVDEAERARDAAAALRLRQLLVLLDAELWQELLDRLDDVPADDPELVAGVEQLRADALAGSQRIDEALALVTVPRDDSGRLVVSGDERELRTRLAKRVEILFDAGREQDARADLETLAASGDFDNLLFTAQLYQRAELWTDAARWFTAADEAQPDEVPTLFGLGAALERQGEFSASVDVFERLLSLAPAHAPSLNYLGYMFAERGERLDEALPMIRRAVATEPDNGAYVDSLGWVYYQRGELEEALEHLHWATRLVPDDPTVQEHLGDVYRALEQSSRALDAYRRGLALEVDEAQRASLEAKIDALEAQARTEQ